LPLLLAGVSALASSAALAQDNQAAPPPSEATPTPPTPAPPPRAVATEPSAPGEIIVTAQRRAENVLSVPLSIQATTGQQLNNTGIRQVSSLQFTTPGMFVQNGTGYTQVYIRGIGNNIFVGADPSVATFIDDIPRIYGSSVNNFFNVQRVEVLKGAQGGLYGRNATGGVINIITKQPGDKLAAEGRVSYGERNTLHAAGYVNVPLSDHIAWNISVQRDSHDGYITNMAGANPLTGANFPIGVPGTGLPGVPNPIAAAVCGNGAGCTPAQTASFFNRGINPQKSYGNQNFWAVDTKIRFDITDNLKLTLDGDYSKKKDSEGNQWFNPNSPGSQLGAEELFLAFGIPANFNGLYPNVGKWKTLSSTPSSANLTDYGGSGKLELHLDSVDITNITAYRAQHTLYEQNFAHPVNLDVPVVKNRKWYLYEELRAVSNGAGPFHFLGGFTYLRDHFHGETANLLLPPLGLFDTFTESDDDVHNWSIYGQVGYDLTSNLNLTVSGRYIDESNKSVFATATTGLANTPLADRTVSTKAHKFLPSATLSYKLEGGGNIYARYAKGFKSGGINPVVPPSLFTLHNTTTGLIFKPEEVDTYEIGFKNSFLNRKLRVTADIFYNDYSNLQTTAVGIDPALILAIINAGTARTYGAEASVAYQVAKPFTLSLNAGYLDAKYKRFVGGGDNVIQPFDFSHTRMLFSPEWQVSINADLDQPLNDRLRLVGNILASYTSKTKAALSTTPGVPNVEFPSYWLTNLRLGVRTNDDHYGVYLVVTNVFDQRYYTFGSASNFGASQVWGDPRIISGELQVKF
jgi:iron complex outermembrane receptor protein